MSFEKEIQEIKKLSVNFNSDNVVRKIIEVSEKYTGNDRFLILSALVEISIIEGKMIGIEDLKNKLSKNIDNICNDALIKSEF